VTAESVGVDVADAGKRVAEPRFVTVELHTLVVLHRATVDHLRLGRRRYALRTHTTTQSSHSLSVYSFGSRVVSVLDSGAVRPGFKSQPQRCRVTSLRQTVHTHRASVHQAAKLVAPLLRVARVTAGLAGSNAATVGFMTYDTCRLTAKIRDQLQNPTLGNQVWATFTFTFYCLVQASFWGKGSNPPNSQYPQTAAKLCAINLFFGCDNEL